MADTSLTDMARELRDMARETAAEAERDRINAADLLRSMFTPFGGGLVCHQQPGAPRIDAGKGRE
jgi:hypothetical protein